jgi:molybdopterin molybdotransferase
VAALVNFLIFGRPLIRKLLHASDINGTGSTARAAETFFHKTGRTEFMPASIATHDDEGFPVIQKLGRGGSARFLPLVNADGFAEIGPDVGDVVRNAILKFHPFSAAFAL